MPNAVINREKVDVRRAVAIESTRLRAEVSAKRSRPCKVTDVERKQICHVMHQIGVKQPPGDFLAKPVDIHLATPSKVNNPRDDLRRTLAGILTP